MKTSVGRMMNKQILIIGGYGNVGRIIAARLCERFPGQVIVAGRNFRKAEGLSRELERQVVPLELDVSRIAADDERLAAVGIVIMCLDQDNVAFIRQCVRRGIHYIDISASYHILSGIEALNREAEEGGATVVLSVGLAPGLTNLLVKYSLSKLPDMSFADIYLLFGLGDPHGDAAYQWIFRNLNSEFIVRAHGKTIPVKSFGEGKQTIFPGETGRRTGYRFNFAEQHVLSRTLGLRRVSTWLCFDSAVLTGLFALLKKTGLSRILRVKIVEKLLIGILKRFPVGSKEFIIKVEAGSSPGNAVLHECSLQGEGEARMTGLVTAKVAEKVASASFPPGVFHIEQLINPAEFIAGLGDQQMKFAEKPDAKR